jgi:HNH endonuclease
VEDFLKDVKEFIKYEPASGRFFIIQSSRKKYIGTETALTNGPKGYLLLKYKGKMIRTHRLAWFIVHNEWPDQIDHINGDRKDNRICNLRNVTNRENSANHYKHRAGKLVGSNLNHGRWQSSIRINGKLKYLGNFDTELQAHEAYIEHSKEIKSL